MKECALCHKGSTLGGRRSFLRSHYNPVQTLRKYPNLQWAKLPSRPVGQGSLPRAAGKRVKVCVKCLKKRCKS